MGGFRAASELSKVPCTAQHLFGLLKIAADADLTLCTAGRGTAEKASSFNGEAESDSSRSCACGTRCTGALPEVLVPGSVTKSAFKTGLLP